MANVFSIQERTALITGGAQGLGEHLAERLAQEYGVPTLGLPMNVTDEAQVAAGFDAAIEKFGRLDICVANAGILKSGPSWSLTSTTGGRCSRWIWWAT